MEIIHKPCDATHRYLLTTDGPAGLCSTRPQTAAHRRDWLGRPHSAPESAACSSQSWPAAPPGAQNTVAVDTAQRPSRRDRPARSCLSPWHNTQDVQPQERTARRLLQKPAARENAASAAGLTPAAAVPIDGACLLQQVQSHSVFMRAWCGRVTGSMDLHQDPVRGHIDRHHSRRNNSTLAAMVHSNTWFARHPANLCTSSTQIQAQLASLHSLDETVHLRGAELRDGRALEAVAADGCIVHHACHDDVLHTGSMNTILPGTGSHSSSRLQHGATTVQMVAAGLGALALNVPLEQRMFDRWQAVMGTTGQAEASPAIEGHLTMALWASQVDSIQGALQQAVYRSSTTPHNLPACGLDTLIATAASVLLDKCTVQSIKKQAEACCICLENIQVNELAPLLMCTHRMHRPCLLKWLMSQCLAAHPAEQGVVCPMCKQVSVDRAVLSSI